MFEKLQQERAEDVEDPGVVLPMSIRCTVFVFIVVEASSYTVSCVALLQLVQHLTDGLGVLSQIGNMFWRPCSIEDVFSSICDRVSNYYENQIS